MDKPNIMEKEFGHFGKDHEAIQPRDGIDGFGEIVDGGSVI